MKISPMGKERRRFPRLPLDLPFEYRVVSAPYSRGGIVVNASEVGLLIQSIKNIPIGTKLMIAVLFSRGFELTSFKVFGEVIWKDLHWKDNWEGFHYGLKIIQLLEEDRRKLRRLLSSRVHPGEFSHPLMIFGTHFRLTGNGSAT